MAIKDVSVDFSKFSHLKENVRMVNAMQIPSLSGNAPVQMSSVPNIGASLFNYRIIAAYKLYDYIGLFCESSPDASEPYYWFILVDKDDPSKIIFQDLLPDDIEITAGNGQHSSMIQIPQAIEAVIENTQYIIAKVQNTAWLIDFKSDKPNEGIYLVGPNMNAFGGKVRLLYAINTYGGNNIPIAEAVQNVKIYLNWNHQWQAHISVYMGGRYPTTIVYNIQPITDLNFFEIIAPIRYYDYRADKLGLTSTRYWMPPETMEDLLDYLNSNLSSEIIASYTTGQLQNILEKNIAYNRKARQQFPDNIERVPGLSNKSGTGIFYINREFDFNIADINLITVPWKGVQIPLPDLSKALWIENIAGRVILIGDNNRFFYTEVGSIFIDPLSYYEMEYWNSKPLACFRCANRLVMFGHNAIEFWDLTSDFENPLSPRQGGSALALTVLINSIIRVQDALFFIAKPNETDIYGIYALAPTGQLEKISYPALDIDLTDQFSKLISELDRLNAIEEYPAYMTKVKKMLNYNLVASVAAPLAVPCIYFKFYDQVLAYNTMFGTFFLAPELVFNMYKYHAKYNDNTVGLLNDFSSESSVALKNINFGNTRANVAQIVYDFDTEGQTEKIITKIIRLAGSAYATVRELAIVPNIGKRNIIGKLNMIGSGTDLQTEMNWTGNLRFNRISYNIEA